MGGRLNKRDWRADCITEGAQPVAIRCSLEPLWGYHYGVAGSDFAREQRGAVKTHDMSGRS